MILNSLEMTVDGCPGNRSPVGTLVERTTGFVVLATMGNATTKTAVDSFSPVLNRKPAAMRKTMKYDQGREMHGHKVLTERIGGQIYFADPHSLWQRGSNENINGLLLVHFRIALLVLVLRRGRGRDPRGIDDGSFAHYQALCCEMPINRLEIMRVSL